MRYFDTAEIGTVSLRAVSRKGVNLQIPESSFRNHYVAFQNSLLTSSPVSFGLLCRQYLRTMKDVDLEELLKLQDVANQRGCTKSGARIYALNLNVPRAMLQKS